MEKFRIFDQNLWENSIFFNLFKKGFYSLESLSFHLEYQLKYISRLIFFEKQTMEKFIIFDQNRGLTPFEKFQICNIDQNREVENSIFCKFFRKLFYKPRQPFFPSFLKSLQWKISNF